MPTYIVTKSTYDADIKEGRLVELADTTEVKSPFGIRLLGAISGAHRKSAEINAAAAARKRAEERITPSAEGLVITTEWYQDAEKKNHEIVVEKYIGRFNEQGALHIQSSDVTTITGSKVEHNQRSYGKEGLATVDPKKQNPEEMLALLRVKRDGVENPKKPEKDAPAIFAPHPLTEPVYRVPKIKSEENTTTLPTQKTPSR